MAIDSRRKRASVAGIALAFLAPSVVPDGTIGVEDRQTIAHSYYGISSAIDGVTIGDTSQVGLFDASGGLTLERTLGGTAQLRAFDSTGGITLERTLGATSQINPFTSLGVIQVGEVVDEEQPSGGWLAFQYEQEQYRREDERRRLKAKRASARKIPKKLDRDLAIEFRKIEEREARDAELARLAELVRANRPQIVEDFSKLKPIVDRALTEQSFASLEILERKLKREMEEVQFLLLATQIILNEC